MEGWLTGNASENIKLKEKCRRIRVEVKTESTQSLDNNNENQSVFQNNPYKQETPDFRKVLVEQRKLENHNNDFKDIDLSPLENEIIWSTNIEEPDEKWEFKTLRAEISAAINVIFEKN